MTTYAPQSRPHARHANGWLIAVVVLAATVVALAAWTLLQSGESRSQDKVLVEDVGAAWNARDGDAIERLYTADAVFAFGPDDDGIFRDELRRLVESWHNTVVPVGDPITVDEPPTGFASLTDGVDPHYVVQPVLIHDDVFVTLFEVRGGKVATHLVYEPFVPFARAQAEAKKIG